MTLTYGFYDSVSGDRVYNAEQMSSIFDGVMEDGIHESIGTHFYVTADTGMNINVGSGRAWFNHTWTLNDSAYSLTISTADPLLPRYDAVCIRIDKNSGVRANSLVVIAGTPSSYPQPPTLATGPSIFEYAVAYVYVDAGATTIYQGDITDQVGTDETPFIVSGLYMLIAPGAVGPAELATGAVTANKIGTGAVTNSKILDDAVTSGKIIDDAIIAGKLATGAIDTSSILVDSVVTSLKIANRTRRFFVPAHAGLGAGTVEQYGVILPDNVTGRISGWFRVPSDFASSLTAKAIIYSGASGNLYSLNSADYGAVGEGFSAHNVYVGPAVSAIAASTRMEVQSLSLSSANAGDYVNMYFYRQAGDVLDTINQQCYMSGWLVDYLADS